MYVKITSGIVRARRGSRSHWPHPAVREGHIFRVVETVTWYGERAYVLAGVKSGRVLPFKSKVLARYCAPISILEMWATRLQDRAR